MGQSVQRSSLDSEVAPPWPTIQHAGEELSYELSLVQGNTIMIMFGDGSEKRIPARDKPRMDCCCPSIEGTVIIVYFVDGTASYYDVLDGVEIDREYLEQVKRGERRFPGSGKITFYS